MMYSSTKSEKKSPGSTLLKKPLNPFLLISNDEKENEAELTEDEKLWLEQAEYYHLAYADIDLRL